MKYMRSRFPSRPAHRAWLAAGLLAACAVAALPATGLAKSNTARKAGVTAKPTIITVTAGKPSELAFKLSKYSNLPVGKPVEFKITDGGLGFHDFKICASPATSFKANSCTGVATKVLHPGQSATVTVTFKKNGMYEFLCSVTGHAAAGMKGLVGAGVAVTAGQETAAAPSSSTSSKSSSSSSSSSSSTSTPPATTTTTASSGGSTAGDGCPTGVTIATSGGTDNDQDENGGPSDGDGCL